MHTNSENKPLPTRRGPRLVGFGYSAPGDVYFVTIGVADQTAPFLDQQLARIVVDALLYQRQTGRVVVHAYVLMPDHLHVVLSLCEGGGSLPALVRDFKGYTAHSAWKIGHSGPWWQRSFYDHVVRESEDLARICEYVVANPVRKGLVVNAQEWPFVGMPDLVPDWE